MKRQARILAVMVLLAGGIVLLIAAIERWGEYVGIGMMLGACAVALYMMASLIVDILGRDASNNRDETHD